MFQKRHPWQEAAFLRLIIPLIAGIICAWYLPSSLVLPFFPTVGILLGIVSCFIAIINVRAIPPAVASSVLYVLLFLTGGILTLFHDAEHRTDFAGRQLNDSSLVVLRLREPLVEKPASWKAEADIIRVINDRAYHHTTGRAILYFQKDKAPLTLHYGDIIITRNRLQEIRNSGNPGSFDYKRYCHLKNIFFQSYLPANSWEKTAYTSTNLLEQFFLNCRSWCIKILVSYVPGKRELGLAEALLVGYRDNIEKELVQAYANVGVVHIIAISGLHLGLIYLILIFILKPIPEKGPGRWIKGTILILSLWCFALITGAAPSALRASLMFSFFTAGKFFIRRKPNKYNTIAASAFLLLCCDPFTLFDVGFQLSYLAVLGIMIFQKPIYKLVVTKNKALNYVWEMTSLSLAAEILIFPIAIFYFHRFPILFLLANLLIIPLSSFILYGEIILLIISFIPAVASFLGIIVHTLIAFMNNVIEWMDALSFSSWSGMVVGPVETLYLYGFVTMLSIWLLRKKKSMLFAALSFFLCFSLSKMLAEMKTIYQKKIIVYNISRHQAIDFIEGQSVCFVGDSTVIRDPDLQRYSILPSRVKLQAVPGDSLYHFLKRGNFIRFFNLRIAVIDSSGVSSPDRSFPVNYVLVSYNPNLEMKEIKRIFSPKLIVFDASNSPWKIEKWKTACKQLNLHCFSVPDSGAWTLSLK